MITEPGKVLMLKIEKSIVLIGLMGAGKSNIGRKCARLFKLGFTDSDTAVENAAGMSIAMIFDLYGEEAFRKLEAKTLGKLLDGTPGIIATGGGAFLNDTTRALIKEKSISVWLKAQPATLADRISNTDSRPLLKDRDPVEVLTELAEIRYPVYAEADLSVDTDGLSLADAVKKVKNTLMEYFDAEQPLK